MARTYYQILGLRGDASTAEIKSAYRQRAMECHPDRGGSHEQMLLINEAFQILSDQESRRLYDDSLRGSTQEIVLAERVQRAQQRAEDYPRTWSEFERWFEAITADFARAKYGADGEGIVYYPTIENSVSGGIFLLLGAALGGWLYSELPLGRPNPWAILMMVIGGAWVGSFLHKLLNPAHSISSPQTPTPAAAVAVTSVYPCPTCNQQLRASTSASRLRCPKCGTEFVR